MKKNILLPLFALFLLSHVSLNAQSNNEIQCHMTIDEISEAQPFDVDHPKQEETRRIASVVLSELLLVYDKVNNNTTVGLTENIETINTAINSAEALGMNYSMFDADLEFIETLN